MQKKLVMIRDFITCLSGIQVNIIDLTDDSLQNLLQDTFDLSVLGLFTREEIIKNLERLENNCIYMISILPGLYYIIIHMPDDSKYLIAGPCMTDEFSENKIRGHLRSLKIKAPAIQQAITYYSWQPTLSYEKLYQLGNLLASHALNLSNPLIHRRIDYDLNRQGSSPILAPEVPVQQSQIREVEKRYETSTALTEAVKQGNLSLALHLLQSNRAFSSSLVRNTDSLRNAQNFCIIMNTQLRHSMEENKIHPYRLDVLSSDIAKHIENLKSLEEAGNYFSQIIHRYCDLALEKNYSHLSTLTQQAVTYIKTHLTENISVKDTAKALLVNANYLSGKFHEEMKMTFTTFVNQERVMQAAALLSKTNMQIQQIAVSVGYDNVSYFSKQFFRFYGKTPREYKKENPL